MTKKHIIFLSLGSNLGDKKDNLQIAIKFLNNNQIKTLKVSSFYETEPAGVKDQPKFLNGALKAETSLSPKKLLKAILKIEKDIGRVRKEKWGPRIIDIDILLYDSLIINEKGLIIPHPLMLERNFVLIPLKEIEPDLVHPLFKKKLSECIKNK